MSACAGRRTWRAACGSRCWRCPSPARSGRSPPAAWPRAPLGRGPSPRAARPRRIPTARARQPSPALAAPAGGRGGTSRALQVRGRWPSVHAMQDTASDGENNDVADLEGALMAKWSANDIPDLSGKTAVVTGANSGLGYETAVALAGHGANVVLACRDEKRGTEALERVRREAPQASAELSLLDLADLTSVRKFAESYAGERSQLDILVNNAGVMALDERRQTADGFEMQFGTNHLGHYALTGLLLPQLLARPGGRVVSVTSFGHKVGRINFDDLQWERSYRKWLAYGRSKLANLLFTFEFDRRARAAGPGGGGRGAPPRHPHTHPPSGPPFQRGNLHAPAAAGRGP